MIQIGLSLTGLRTGISGDGGTPPAGPGYYPDVPAVDLTAAAGSFQMPEGNWTAAAGLAGRGAMKGALAQQRTNLPIAGSAGGPQATFAIVRWPRDKRRSGSYPSGLFGVGGNGGGKWRLGLNSYSNNAFIGYQSGNGGTYVANIMSPKWDEDTALVVMYHDGADNWAVGWYSLADGTRHAGTPSVVTGVYGSPAGSGYFTIGAWGAFSAFATDAVPAAGYYYSWEGEIAAIGHVVGAAVTPEQWTQIALGAKMADVLPVAAVKFVREFDGSDATLTRPA